MDLHMKGKVAVVAGGSTGIGFATALCFLEEGCKVAVFARNAERLEAAKEQFAALGYKDVMTGSADATLEEAVNKFAADVAAHLAPLITG